LSSAPDEAADGGPSSRRARLQLGAVFALIIGYAALSQYSASTHASGFGAALSLAPILLIALVLLWRWSNPLIAVLGAILLCAVLYRYWPLIEKNYTWADLAQQCGIYGLISLSFARSLFGGRTPMCTVMAEKLHGTLTAREVAYTRRATAAWAVFYLLLTAAILTLFFLVSPVAWSAFVNFATFGLIIAAGIVDLAVRHYTLPRRPSGGILAIIRRSLIG
jgi:uncharacterized membrane protein